MVMERFRFRKSDQEGFTLIEMAIVLVVIGLILGMVFKGRQLIAGAKVKNSIASYNKVIAGVNTYYDRYGMYPGDGCETASDYDANDPISCRDGTQDGLIDNTDEETEAFWAFLIDATRILSASDRESALGSRWEVGGDTVGSWIFATGADRRIVCDMNRLADNGRSDTGDILSLVNGSRTDIVGAGFGNLITDKTTGYDAATDDCWALTGTTTVYLRILP